MNLSAIRNEYKFAQLTENLINQNPIKQFDIWLNDALRAKVNEPTAMSLSTFGTDGFPQTRIVLLKAFDQIGYTFFTNYQSEKGRAIENNNTVGLHFFWPELERQIRISGFAEKTSIEISDEYFSTRPELSQIAATVSRQSKKIPSRFILEKQFDELKTSLKNKELKRPDFWGGFIVKPIKIEFWQGRENRLHDRILYEKINENWEISRLAP